MIRFIALVAAALLGGCTSCDAVTSTPDAAIVFDFDGGRIAESDAGERMDAAATSGEDAGDAGGAGPTCLPAATDERPIALRLNADRRFYYPTDPIRLSAVGFNLAGHDLLVPSGALDSDAILASLQMVGPDGLVARADGSTPGELPEWVCAEPGRSREIEVIAAADDHLSLSLAADLRELFELGAPGTYTLSAQIPFVTYSSASGGIADEGDLEYCCGLFTLTSFTLVEPTGELIEAGGTYGDYAVVDVTIGAAAAGDYTFHVADPRAGEVEVRLDGATVATLAYPWGTTVSASDPAQFYTFDFPELFSITVRRAGTGTANLYGLDHSIFDGARILRVP